MSYADISGVGRSGEQLPVPDTVHYVAKCKLQFNLEKMQKIAEGVAAIQQSIGWDPMDLRIATRRLQLSNNPKIIIKDPKTMKLLGYAILRPEGETGNEWYLSQMATMKDSQGHGIGKAMMRKIFEEALSRGIDRITLETDGDDKKLVRFYESFNSKFLKVESFDQGANRFGRLSKLFIYTIMQDY